MRDANAPMPPDALPSAADVAAFAAWVDAGMPEGTCGSVGPVAAPEPVCTSGRWWTEGDDEGDELMTPGQACIGCHTKENRGEHGKPDEDEDDDDEDDEELEAPAFTAAGTVYPSLHEPDDCFGLSGGAQVVLVGADGVKQTLAVNRAGNFMTERPLALPYTASVVRNGKTRAMKAAQTDGDCNGCHTATGGDAPGRILAP